MWKGTITGAGEADKKLLKELGIKVVSISDIPHGRHLFFDAEVEMEDEVFDKLDPYWGRLIWTLEHT